MKKHFFYLIMLSAFVISTSSCSSGQFFSSSSEKGQPSAAKKDNQHKGMELEGTRPAPEATPSTSTTKSEEKLIAPEETNRSWDEMSRKEKRETRKSLREKIKDVKDQIKSSEKSTMSSDAKLILSIIIALFIPPLGVFLAFEAINDKFWISLILTIASIIVVGGLFFAVHNLSYLLWLAAVIYSIIVIWQHLGG